jgi:membrane-bound lytic murein transglycosylase C
MHHILLFLFAWLISMYCFAANDPFAELDKEVTIYEQESQNSSAEAKGFQQFLDTQENEYSKWRKQYLAEFDQFQMQLVKMWGEADVSQKQRNVEFSDDMSVKSTIDYDNEQVTVAVLVDKDLPLAEAENKARQQVERLITNKNSNISRLFENREAFVDEQISFLDVEFSERKKQHMQDIIIQQTQAQSQDIDKQSDRAQLTGSEVNESEAKLLATKEKQHLLKSTQTRLSTANKNYDQAQISTTKDKKIVIYKVNLPKNSLAKRAEKYVDYAEKESEIRQIPAALVMAIMHSESAFDPNATSSVPAYGLMQIVPRTAGHDVNKLERNIDRPMTKNDLYIPAINVETGAAYLNILDKRYLKAITDDQSRLYCTIAAYNTGAGNVARVFNHDGSRNINKAAKVINSLTAEQVYQRLLAKLPYDETKHYLQRVNTRIALYESKI